VSDVVIENELIPDANESHDACIDVFSQRLMILLHLFIYLIVLYH
jgi:hypothetical protein